ncbi:hypothetical protein [Ostreibacterium oceani]|uniref:Uncharacterized protein n=1 Tax=Ostreibacterium oceani TaxID=2654998 RepID=A0A6N7EXX6_9GAMM|nr:hypothetical protein [Ostreibacterium oceani]MPV85318.1 hypothetical protein [Ostreibacterium oceani]
MYKKIVFSAISFLIIGVSQSRVDTVFLSTNDCGNRTYHESKIIKGFNETPGKVGLRVRMYETSGTLYDLLSTQSHSTYSQGTGMLLSRNSATKKTGGYPWLPDSINNYSAFQVDCGKFGSFINRYALDNEANDVNGGGHNTVYSYVLSTPKTVFDNVYDELWLQINNLKMNQIYTAGGSGVGQVVMYAYFKDIVTNQTFATLFLIYDNRMRTDIKYTRVMHDGGNIPTSRGIPFTSASINSDNKYMNSPLHFGFSPTQGGLSTFSKSFRVQITRQKFINMLKDINSFCAARPTYNNCSKKISIPSLSASDPRWTNFKLTDVAILHEVFDQFDGFDAMSMGISGSGLGIYRYNRN